MKKIRSTEKKVQSPSSGLCDIQRDMIEYKEDLVKGTISVIIVDKIFQEKPATITIDVIDEESNEVTQEQVDVIERKYIRGAANKTEKYVYKSSDIDNIFSSIGTDILVSGNYTEQHNANQLSVLIAMTAMNQGYYGMTIWTEDTDYVLVSEFSE